MNSDELRALEEDMEEAEATPAKASKKSKKSSGKPGDVVTWWNSWSAMVDDASRPLQAEQIVRTGVLPLDVGLGVGGLPMGSVVTIFGGEGSAKSTLAQTIVGECQRQYPDKIVLWVDAEHSFVGATAMRNGMIITKELFDAKRLMFVNPDLDSGLSYEKIIIMLEQLMPVAPDGVICVVDSLDSMSTSSEILKSADDGGASFGGMAKVNSITLKRIIGTVRKTNSCLILIQQLRDKIGAMGYGPQTDTSGGHAVKHYSHIRLELKPIKRLKTSDDTIIGHTIRAMLLKNRFYRPYVEFEFDLYYAFDEDGGPDQGGIDRVGCLIDIGESLGLVEVNKASHTFTTLIDEKGAPTKKTGRQNVRQWLMRNPDIADSLRGDIYRAMNSDE